MATGLYLVAGLAFLMALAVVVARLLRVYLRYRGKMLVTCPETREPTGVELDAKYAALSALTGDNDLVVQACSRWPEHEDCGQACLLQIEGTPENCLVRTRLSNWYRGQHCVYCGTEFSEIHWHDHKPGLLSPEHDLLEWSQVPVESLPQVFASHKPVCWNCFVAETFRREHPDLVTDRPWKRGSLA